MRPVSGARRLFRSPPGLRVVVCLMTLAWLPAVASAQIAALVSPGKLNRAHASLEGVGRCLSCHTAGQRVSAEKCLGCHQPIAARIAKKVGVHRSVATDCVACHVEHAGADAELRPFDQRTFDHASQTGFALDGRHAPLRTNCASCHKTRSFLTLSSACASCHTDVHKGSLGTSCATCHATARPFADARTSFDHGRTGFPLSGSHAKVACASCHRNNVFTGLQAGTCSTCHMDVHAQRFGATCTSCHTSTTWKTTRVNHARTAFPLRGKHEAVACAGCHTSPPMKAKPASATCATCHADPHRGTFKQDCSACHTESGFGSARFDHSSTRFPLVDKHAGLACVKCHANAPPPGGSIPAAVAGAAVPGTAPRAGPAPAATRAGPAPAGPVPLDYRGLKTDCASCHTDVHRGELGTSCESCHTTRTFTVTSFTHRAQRPFFGGQHASLTCAQCHQPPGAAAPRPPGVPAAALRAGGNGAVVRTGFTQTPTACASCHRDVHLGQVGSACETCHSIDTPRFGLAGFAHGTTKFPLTGKHAAVMCESCHKVETREFPAAHGEARRLTGLGTACAACHQDVHGGELPQTCETCHTTGTFRIERYTHRNARALHSFFAGPHLTATCTGCHKTSRPLPGTGRVVASFRSATACATCHTDVHRGSLGPRCETCHRL